MLLLLLLLLLLLVLLPPLILLLLLLLLLVLLLRLSPMLSIMLLVPRPRLLQRPLPVGLLQLLLVLHRPELGLCVCVRKTVIP